MAQGSEKFKKEKKFRKQRKYQKVIHQEQKVIFELDLSEGVNEKVAKEDTPRRRGADRKEIYPSWEDRSLCSQQYFSSTVESQGRTLG